MARHRGGIEDTARSYIAVDTGIPIGDVAVRIVSDVDRWLVLAAMPRRKQVYKITYPNGKVYVGMDLTRTILYFGSPSAHEQIAADLDIEAHRLELTLRKEILWESETATDAEVRVKEMELIRETRANDPAVGYNKLPRHRHPPSAE
ncbi:MAG TPA: hypothetical protein VEF72_25835 [Mycobacterium sp.]|nr:hypothetical protein [Mycobacterium sp.]